MSAVLEISDIQPVADLLEKVQNVQRAIRDLHDGYDGGVDGDAFYVSITQGVGVREVPIANTHTLSYWFVLRGLAAIECELIGRLGERDIAVASVLPVLEA